MRYEIDDNFTNSVLNLSKYVLLVTLIRRASEVDYVQLVEDA